MNSEGLNSRAPVRPPGLLPKILLCPGEDVVLLEKVEHVVPRTDAPPADLVEPLGVDPVLFPLQRIDGGGGIGGVSRAEVAGLLPVKVFALEGEAPVPGRLPLVDDFKPEEIRIPGERRVVGDRREVRFPPGVGRAEEDRAALPDLHRGLREDRERMGAVFRAGAEQMVVLTLQTLDSKLKVDGEIRDPGHLDALLPSHPFRSHERAVIERCVDEIPCMGMLGVDAAEAALELPPLTCRPAGREEVTK